MKKPLFWALPILLLLLFTIKTFAGSELLLSTSTQSTSKVRAIPKQARTFQAVGSQTGIGAGLTTVKIEGSNVNSSINNDWVTLQDIPLVLSTTSTGAGFSSTAPWGFVRARVMSISGTGAAVSIYVGY